MPTDKPKRATTSVRTRKGHQTNKKKTATTKGRTMTRSKGKIALDPPTATATSTNEDEILVVMYYHSPDEGPSPSNIFDCHICGQKFRVFPRIEQHYLKEHGCVVMKCGEDGKSKPRISCPDFPRTVVKQEQGQRTNPLTDFINKQRNKKRKAEVKVEDAATNSVQQVKMEPIEVDIEDIDIPLPLEDDSEVVSATKAGPDADSGEASAMSQSQSAEFKPSKPKRKAGWPKGKARPRKGDARPPNPMKVAVVCSPDGSKSPEPGLLISPAMADTSSHSLSGSTATPWEILQLNTPVPGKLRLKKGRPTAIATPATVATPASLVTSSSSGSLSSHAKAARDSRYARRLEAKESGAHRPTAGPRKLELITIKIEPEEYESSPRTDTEEERPEEGLKEPHIEVMAETGTSAAELLVDDPAKHSQMEDQINDTTVKMTPTEIENSVQHDPQENLVVVSPQPGMSTAGNNCPTFASTGDDVMLPEAVAVEDNDAELMEFLAKESGFGGLKFTGLTNDSIDWSILDEFLEDNMPIRGPDSDYDPDLAMIAPDEAGLALVAAMCQSPLPLPPCEENLPAEVKTPETETRKRKLAESTYNAGLLKGSHPHSVRPKKTKLNMEAAGNDTEDTNDFDDTENLNPHPDGENRDNYLKCSSADVMFSSTIVESPSKRLRMLQFQSSFDSDSDLSFISFTSPKPNL